MIIPNKDTFYRLAFEGKCGNTPKMWRSAVEFIKDTKKNKNSLYGVRSLKPMSSLCEYDLDKKGVISYIIKNRIPTEDRIITSIPENQDLLEHLECLQGEFTINSNLEFELYYTKKYGFMRKMLSKHGKIIYGKKALHLINMYCDSRSVDMIFNLFTQYSEPGKFPTIEFTCIPFGIERFGIDKSMNTIIWEVRHY